jgi:hypothetical protein
MRMIPASRRLTAPRWAAAIVAAWLGAVAALHLAKAAGHDVPTLCTWRNVTGIPCPTCGTTRMVLAAADGRLADAVAWNPFMAIAATMGVAWLALRVIGGRRVEVEMTPAGRRVAWGLVAIAFAINWIYLLAR